MTLKLDPAVTDKIFHHWSDYDGVVPKDSPATLTLVMDGHKWVRIS